jgi:hypothetical protein
MRRIHDDPDEAHKRGACSAWQNAAKKLANFAEVSSSPPRGSRLSPTQNFDRILDHIKTQKRTTHQQINVLAKAIEKAKASLILRFPRERK